MTLDPFTRFLADATAGYLTATLPNWQHLPPEAICDHLFRQIAATLVAYRQEGWVVPPPSAN